MSNFVKATQAYQQGQRTLPGRYYTLAEIYAEERERIFTARWICVGRAADIPAAGDYLLRTIAGESVIVVRGRDGALRAFYNVCRHRGTRLCEEPRGRFSETRSEERRVGKECRSGLGLAIVIMRWQETPVLKCSVVVSER